MRIYLDNCCFNRPYDDQSQLKIYLETKAKLNIQKEILEDKHELVWSFILEYENRRNPFAIRKNAIGAWQDIAKYTVSVDSNILHLAKTLLLKGIKKKDALHIACAIGAGCSVFLTTDKKLLHTPVEGILIMSPIEFVIDLEE